MANPRHVLAGWALSLPMAIAVPCGGCVPTGETGFTPRAPGGAVEGSYEPPSPEPRSEVQDGNATWYGAAFAGRRTASGEPFNPLALTAAHRTLPFGTWVEVTRVDTGASVRVRITDRGPYAAASQHRIIDLSRGAAERIDLVRAGVTRVEVRVVEGP
ncbi:MAG TPA: septal ring lytic transglycosylase RlpA family protein [Polyangiaceae bacterium]|jgi:rare lipoprotein A